MPRLSPHWFPPLSASAAPARGFPCLRSPSANCSRPMMTKDPRLGTRSAPLTTDVLVRNVAPTLSNVAVTPAVAEGGTVTLTGNVSDPGPADLFTLTVNWGDGSGPQTIALAAGATSFAVPHTYRDNPAG